MKNKMSLLLVLTMALAMALVSSVSAQEAAVAKSDKAVENQNAKANNQVNATDTETTDATATDSQDKGKKEENKENKGKVTAEEHRSTVATFVQSLLAVADREGGIGQQVKVIAQQQNEAKEKVAESIDKVEKRGKFKTFLIGTDYKNTGALRSEMVKTRNQIEQLKRLADKAENDQDKTELQNQIQILEQERTSIENLITQNENKFSLFGWVVKLLNK